jgi:subtilisin family serine protease
MLERIASTCGRGPDIVNLSFGGYTDDDDAPPLAVAIERMLADTVIVASAGNSGSPRPSYPAALDGVVAVGAVGPSGRAWFSNYGGWVDACAPGIDVVSTYFANHTETSPPERVFDGWAAWSGTSFAAPKVVGALARDMYLHRSTAGEAWRRLGHWTLHREPDMGIVINEP